MPSKKLHRAAGSFIALFIIVHLTNHLMSNWGADAHIALMNKLRVVYRNPVVETILLAAVGIQVLSGIKLFNAKRKTATGFIDKLQMWSGLYLAMFFIIHLTAVMVGRYVLDLDTNYYFGAAGLNVFPSSLFFIPYYSLAIVAFFGHLAAIHHTKMQRSVLGISVQRQSALIGIIGVIIAGATIWGLTNGFTGIDLPAEYNIMIGQ